MDQTKTNNLSTFTSYTNLKKIDSVCNDMLNTVPLKGSKKMSKKESVCNDMLNTMPINQSKKMLKDTK